MPSAIQTTIRPFMVYQGGKRKMMKHLTPNLPRHFNNYFEPFLGGGALALDILSKQDSQQERTFYLSDWSSDVVDAWTSVKEEPQELAEQLEHMFAHHCESAFYSIRNWDREGTLNLRQRVERAARFIYLQQTNFGGLVATNREGFSKASYGWKPACGPHGFSAFDYENMFAVSELLNRFDTRIFQASYETSIADASYGDFIYLDPPYEDEGGKISSSYLGASPLSHTAIRENIDEVTSRGALVLLSNSDTSVVQEIYNGWAAVRPAYRWAISGASSAVNREILIANWRLADHLAKVRA